MRKIVAVEGIPTKDGRLLLPGALEPADNAIPIWLRPNHGAERVIGNATDFYRDEDTGEVSFSCFIDDFGKAYIKEHDLFPHVYATDLVTQQVAGVEQVHQAIVRGIYFSRDFLAWQVR